MSRLFWLTLLSIPLVSCSMNNDDDQLSHNNRVIERQKVKMADARGINTQFLNNELRSLVAEATDIEKQMQALASRLDALKNKISGFDTTIVEASPVVRAQASENPKTILPVPERPKVVKQQPKPKPKKKVMAKKTSSSAKGVVGVRVGVHKDKTRLVFDMNGSTAHKVDFDKEAGLLTISLPKTPWATRPQKSYRLSQLSGYDVNKQGEGSMIALGVKKTSSVKTGSIKAIKGKPVRLVVDLIK